MVGTENVASVFRKNLMSMARFSYTPITYWENKPLAELRLWIESAVEEGDHDG